MLNSVSNAGILREEVWRQSENCNTQELMPHMSVILIFLLADDVKMLTYTDDLQEIFNCTEKLPQDFE